MIWRVFNKKRDETVEILSVDGIERLIIVRKMPTSQRALIDALCAYWREHERGDSGWQRLVYRAISASDDDALADVLEEIYEDMGSGSYQMKEFYWTIRSMDGEKVQLLRKRIRKEVGMERLR